jgi:hypothetical protein
MKKDILFATALLLTAAAALSRAEAQEKFTAPITIDPAVAKLSGAHVLASGKKFVLGEFADAAGVDSVIGQTRTGRKTVSQIVSRPGPAEAAKRTLAGALSEQGALVEAGGGAGDFLVSASVSKFRLEEVSMDVRQKMSASLIIEVVVADAADPERVVRKFKIEAGGERMARDTTKHAAATAREAVQTAVGEILKNLDSL